MLPWLFGVLLVLNLALFWWGRQHQIPIEPELPPVAEAPYQIRLLDQEGRHRQPHYPPMHPRSNKPRSRSPATMAAPRRRSTTWETRPSPLLRTKAPNPTPPRSSSTWVPLAWMPTPPNAHRSTSRIRIQMNSPLATSPRPSKNKNQRNRTTDRRTLSGNAGFQ